MKNSFLIVSGIYPPDTGGPATFSRDFAIWLKRKNFDVSVITYTDTKSRITFEDGVRVIRVKRDKYILKRYLEFVWVLLKNYDSSVKVLAAGAFIEIMVASLIRKIKYTIKIPGDIVWERARNSGYSNLDIVEFQNSKLNLKYKFFRMLFIMSINRANKIVVPSLGLKKLVLGWIGNSKKIELVYNSVDPSKFSNQKSLEKRFNVVTASRLVPWKRVDEIIRSCHELNLTLGIAGDGPDEIRLKELSGTLSAPVTFIGQIPKSEMPEFYLTGEIFILNSSYEGLPHALIEAKSSGLVCIGKVGTGCEEVITNEVDGILVEDPSELSLKIALKRLQSDPKLVARIKLNARKDVMNRFNQNINFQKFYDVLWQP